MLYKFLTFIILLTMLNVSYGYELVVIQGLSKEKQTFITRNHKENEIIEGKKRTFTSDNVSIIAKAITITGEFTQWEIENDFTDVPFTRGQIVTMYDAEEYLWTLTPEKIKRRYIKDKIYSPRRSMEVMLGFSKGLSESTSESETQNTDRGGYEFAGLYHKELSMNWSFGYGVRYSKEVVNIADASFINQRFLAIAEGRYHFDPMENFYNSQIGLSLGFGIGQSRTETSGQAIFGNAVMIPSTKISLALPINKDYDAEFSTGFESYRLDESTASDIDLTTNLTNYTLGVAFRKHL